MTSTCSKLTFVSVYFFFFFFSLSWKEINCPRYITSSTFSISSFIILIVLSCFFLLNIFVFCVFIDIPASFPWLSSSSIIMGSSSLFLAIRTTSSGKRRLFKYSQFMSVQFFSPFSPLNISSRAQLNNMGDSGSPCLISLYAEVVPCRIIILALVLLYNFWMVCTQCSGMPCLRCL